MVDGYRTQYYIPESVSRSGSSELSVAVTFRDDPSIEEAVSINYSVFLPDRDIKVPIRESLVSASGKTIELGRISLLYREIRKDIGIVRISSTMTRAAFIELLGDGLDAFLIQYQDGAVLRFIAPERLKEDLRSIALYLYD
ncbi:MAG: hypothetical protein KKA67_05205 [Spirochaetes bacterium]|nr:hypothetical protein [Spirochaetota bacterium]MBU1079326.1 hypothetical protein [Spirochaetota bacterium]